MSIVALNLGDGLHHIPGWWGGEMQRRARDEVHRIAEVAPLRRPSTPSGHPMRVRITSAGARAWWSDDRGGYRYIDTQPDGRPLPPAPAWILEDAIAAVRLCRGREFHPDAVLVNWYSPDAALGSHRDESEPDQDAPIVSFSLGSAAPFYLRGPERTDAISKRVTLESGDCLVMLPPARGWYHEVPRILESDPLFSPLREPGRISILVRKVTP